eukprot:COSAG02_NODE_1562_length_11922_cov_3.632411_5_plen_169_part_00
MGGLYTRRFGHETLGKLSVRPFRGCINRAAAQPPRWFVVLEDGCRNETRCECRAVVNVNHLVIIAGLSLLLRRLSRIIVGRGAKVALVSDGKRALEREGARAERFLEEDPLALFDSFARSHRVRVVVAATAPTVTWCCLPVPWGRRAWSQGPRLVFRAAGCAFRLGVS